MNAPSITPAQWLAALAAILGLLVSLSVLDDAASQAILAAAAVLVPIAVVLADAHIRNGRAQAIARGAVVRSGRLFNPDDEAAPR